MAFGSAPWEAPTAGSDTDIGNLTMLDQSITVTQAPGATLSASLNSGNLTVTDIDGTKNNELTISVVDGNLTLAGSAEHFGNSPSGWTLAGDSKSISIPVGSFSGSITLNTGGGNDTLTVDLAGGDAVPAGNITFNGGTPTTGSGDSLVITGGSQGTVTYDYANATDGSVKMSNFGVVNYTGLEPITNSGTAADVIFNLPAGPSVVTLGDDGTGGNGMSRLSSSPTTFELTNFSNPTGSLTINRGNAADTLTVNALPDFNAGLTLGSAANPLSTLTFAGAVTLAANKNLSANASGAISLSATTSDLATSGTGAISLTTARNVVLALGAGVTTVNGALTIDANRQLTPTAGGFAGVDINGGVVQSTGSGLVTVRGTGGDTGINQYGVYVRGAGNITGGSGATLIVGAGGPVSGGSDGVNVSGATVSSAGGSVTVNGTGGGGVDNTNNAGVRLQATGQITAGGTGVVTVIGQGGNLVGTGDNNVGVLVTTGSVITSSGGAVAVTGIGGGSISTSGNQGVGINTGAQITAGGGGTVTVTGTGGGGSTGASNTGVSVGSSTGRISSAGGNVTVLGTGGGGSNSTGVDVTTGSQITAGGSGSVVVTGTGGVANSIGVQVSTSALITSSGGNVQITATAGGTRNAVDLNTNGGVSTATSGGFVTLIADSQNFGFGTMIAAGLSTVTLRQKTTDLAIDLGAVFDTPGVLGLSDDELDRVTAGTVQIGDANSGPITISSNITRPAATMLRFVSGSDIILSGGQVDTAGGGLLLDSGATPTAVKATKAGVDVSASVLSFAGDVAFTLNGTTVDTNYTQLNVVGQVNLTGANLALSGSYAPTAPHTFVLVNNDGVDAVVGSFTGVPEGFVFNNWSLFTGTVSYHGGDGNDVTLSIEPVTQWVNSFAPTTTGARFTLSMPAVVAHLSLYDYRDSGGNSQLGPADVTLVGNSTGAVTGSLLIEAGDQGFRFVATNGVLPPDTYTFTVRSAINGFHTIAGPLLDGNADGHFGGDFVATFTVTAPAANAVTVSVPNFSRGPDQPVNVPPDVALGLPVRVSNGDQIKSLTFTLQFDSGLLNVTGVMLPAGVPGGSSAVLTPQGVGQVQVALTFGSPLSAGAQTVAYLIAVVPTSAASRYGERGPLDLGGLVILNGLSQSIPGLDDDSLDLNAYFGDAGRNGRYDSFDVQQASRMALRLDTGFQQHPLLDATILADFNSNGRIDSFDVQRLSRLALRLPVTEAATLPSPTPTTMDSDRLTEEPLKSEPEKIVAATVSPRSDVDGDGAVDAQDVVWAIYFFNRSENGVAPAEAHGKNLDLNGDESFDAADILLAVTDLNAKPTSVEGDATALETDDKDENLDALMYLLADDLVASRKKQ